MPMGIDSESAKPCPGLSMHTHPYKVPDKNICLEKSSGRKYLSIGSCGSC